MTRFCPWLPICIVPIFYPKDNVPHDIVQCRNCFQLDHEHLSSTRFFPPMPPPRRLSGVHLIGRLNDASCPGFANNVTKETQVSNPPPLASHANENAVVPDTSRPARGRLEARTVLTTLECYWCWSVSSNPAAVRFRIIKEKTKGSTAESAYRR